MQYVTYPSRKKHLFMQNFISILLIFRNYLTQINNYVYYLIIVAFLIAKYFKEGNTVGSVLQYLSFIIIIFADLFQLESVTLLGIIVAVLNHIFISPTIYTLPDYKPRVGLRDNYTKRNNKQLYWAQWYPVQSNQSQSNSLATSKDQYQIPWNHRIQVDRMAEYMKIKNKIMLKLFKFFTSHIKKYTLTFSKGKPAKYEGVILFSHGRTGTPKLYSSLLKSFARRWRILSPQHSQVSVTPYTDIKQIKRYRQIQVKQRGQQIIYMSNKVGQSQTLILMGHSYGCATVLQAYHDMHLSTRKRVSHIVLLDPWLFPLPDIVVQDEIVCPILMLANQHFLNNKDCYQRNLQFIKRHSNRLLYVCWKNADHLHQTDMPFIVGSSLRKIKNSKQCALMNVLNVQAVQMFLQMKKLGLEQIEAFKQKFNDYDLGKQYRPTYFSNQLNF